MASDADVRALSRSIASLDRALNRLLPTLKGLHVVHADIAEFMRMAMGIEDLTQEQLHHDETTLQKVYTSVMKFVPDTVTAQDLINDLLNSGILFRERVKDAEGG
jgi:hypothetical protein